MHRHTLALLLFIAGFLGASSARAEVFHSKQSGLKEAFPDATKVDEKTIYLSAEDSQWIKKRAGVDWPGRVVRAYVGYKGNQVIGYGFIDTHKIRTFNETVMVVLSPDGKIARSFLLAFHEPGQYQASPKWWQQFEGRALDSGVSLRADIDGITGATMTAHAGVAVTRRVLALYERKLAETKVSSR